MSPTDQKLHPGEYFLERQDKPDGSWEVWSRDNDDAVMLCRYEYAVSMLKPGQSVRLFNPSREIVFQKSVDVPAPTK